MLMKSYWMQSDGEHAQIELREGEQPSPAADQLLVRVRAAGLNRGEFILGHGLHKAGAAKPIGMAVSTKALTAKTAITTSAATMLITNRFIITQSPFLEL